MNEWSGNVGNGVPVGTWMNGRNRPAKPINRTGEQEKIRKRKRRLLPKPQDLGAQSLKTFDWDPGVLCLQPPP